MRRTTTARIAVSVLAFLVTAAVMSLGRADAARLSTYWDGGVYQTTDPIWFGGTYTDQPGQTAGSGSDYYAPASPNYTLIQVQDNDGSLVQVEDIANSATPMATDSTNQLPPPDGGKSCRWSFAKIMKFCWAPKKKKWINVAIGSPSKGYYAVIQTNDYPSKIMGWVDDAASAAGGVFHQLDKGKYACAKAGITAFISSAAAGGGWWSFGAGAGGCITGELAYWWSH